jgi:hypothetical protein
MQSLLLSRTKNESQMPTIAGSEDDGANNKEAKQTSCQQRSRQFQNPKTENRQATIVRRTTIGTTVYRTSLGGVLSLTRRAVPETCRLAGVGVAENSKLHQGKIC